MIRFDFRTLSLYGRKVADSLRHAGPEISRHCSCPAGKSCSVEINELPGRRLEVTVSRPDPIAEAHDWTVVNTEFAGVYRRLFEKRARAMPIQEAVVRIVGAPLDQGNEQAGTY